MIKLISFVDTLGIKPQSSMLITQSSIKPITSIPYLAKEYLNEDTLLLESDLIIEDGILEKLVNFHSPNAVLVAPWERMDGMLLPSLKNRISVPDKRQFGFLILITITKQLTPIASVGFLTSHYVPFLEAYCTALGHNEYYEQVLKVIAQLSEPWMHALVLGDEKWYEIDDIQDLDIAETLFEPNPVKRFEQINSRYGGFWRFGQIVDFCYLVNPYFPPPKLVDELQNQL